MLRSLSAARRELVGNMKYVEQSPLKEPGRNHMPFHLMLCSVCPYLRAVLLLLWAWQRGLGAGPTCCLFPGNSLPPLKLFSAASCPLSSRLVLELIPSFQKQQAPVAAGFPLLVI